MTSLEVTGHTVPYLKALRFGIYEIRGLSCGSTSSICQDFLKSDNLLHKQDFVDFLLQTTVVDWHLNAVGEIKTFSETWS